MLEEVIIKIWEILVEITILLTDMCITQNMAWRQKNRVDDILDDKELNQMRKLYPSQTGQAKDKKGRPGNILSVIQTEWWFANSGNS